MANLTFDDLVRLEPRLAELAAEVAADGRRVWFDSPLAQDRWYRVHKRRLVRLVGWSRQPAGFDPPPSPGVFRTEAECVAAAARLDAARAEWFGRLTPDRKEAERVLATSAAYACVYNHLFPLLTGERAYATDRPLAFVFVPPAMAPGG